MDEIIILQLVKEHNTFNFDSGENALDEYLKKYAFENSERGISRAWIALLKSTIDCIVGYYTLSSCHIEHLELSKKDQRGLPKYHIPAIRIGRLAIDKKFQGLGYGAILLYNAIFRIVLISKEVGIRLILVDAKHEQAKKFYMKFGFAALPDNPLKLILPIKSVLALENEQKAKVSLVELV